MSRPLSRRVAASVAAAAVLAGGIGLGAGTAFAAPATGSLGSLGSSGSAGENAGEYPSSATKTTDNIKVTKEVVGGSVAPGQKVTYRTTFSLTGHPDRYLAKVIDHHPAGFTYVQGSAKVNAWHLIGGQKTEPVSAVVDAANGTVSVENGAGWALSTTGSKTVTVELQYLVPQDAKVGAHLDSGVSFNVNLFGSTQKFNPIGAYTTIRPQNPGETVTTGSANLGFGSSDGAGGTTGSAGSAIIENPAGFIGDIISNVLKSAS
ncbi:hypothetical protein ABI214_09410 [Prescottella soli]|uniref:Uncharacterized protein n=1 Tax=Prescottella soli TaxID=1543852 RepID=A0ABW9FNA4_9NOCA